MKLGVIVLVIAAAAMSLEGIAVARDTQITVSAQQGVAVGRGATRGVAYAEAVSRVPLGASVYRREVVTYSGAIKDCVCRLYWKR